MFGKKNLLRDGVATQGVLIESEGGMHDRLDAQSRYRVKIRVQFDDGTTGEFSAKLHVSCGIHYEGVVVPVFYDPDDRSRMEIDEPALQARHDAGAAQVKANAIARGEAAAGMSAAGATAPPPGPPADGVLGILETSIRIAERKGDAAEVARLRAKLAEHERGSAPTPAGATADPIDRLQKLADLHDRGALTDAEFAAEKAKVLGGE
jgi:Short C-terminal domain